jgi:hypothetical protein
MPAEPGPRLVRPRLHCSGDAPKARLISPSKVGSVFVKPFRSKLGPHQVGNNGVFRGKIMVMWGHTRTVQGFCQAGSHQVYRVRLWVRLGHFMRGDT